MIRKFASAALVIAIVILLTGAACMACSDLFHKQPASHSCCKKHKVACAASPVAADLTVSTIAPTSPTAGVVQPASLNETLPSHPQVAVFDTLPYSPPDRCLLNSVLTI